MTFSNGLSFKKNFLIACVFSFIVNLFFGGILGVNNIFVFLLVGTFFSSIGAILGMVIMEKGKKNRLLRKKLSSFIASVAPLHIVGIMLGFWIAVSIVGY